MTRSKEHVPPPKPRSWSSSNAATRQCTPSVPTPDGCNRWSGTCCRTPCDSRRRAVDDEPDAREILRAMLEDAGATVATTASAGETRALMGQLRPDLLIADIGMPNEDGYSLIRSVRALESDLTGHVPAIALTAHA